jgi:outer membrane biosynthesis protein TonB
MTKEHDTTTNQAERPTTRRSTRRSDTSTPEHETRPATEMMKFQPESQSQNLKTTTNLGADPYITIRGGVRADARRHTNTPRGDLDTVSVDLDGGGEWC